MKIPKLNVYQIVIELLCLAALGVMVVCFALIYPELPAHIPGKFSASGEMAAYTDKGIIWLLIGMSALVYVLFTLFIFCPKIVSSPNTPWRLDPRHTESISYEVSCLLSESKLLCIILFAYEALSALMLRQMSLAPVLVVSGLIVLAAVFRMYRISKYKIA